MNYINKLQKCINPTRCWFMSLPLFLLIAGCQNKTPDTEFRVAPPVVVNSAPLPVAPKNAEMRPVKSSAAQRNGVSVCQRELVALSKLNPGLYGPKKAAFDDLLARATVYSSVRNDIGLQTKDTLDALYKYKTQKLCTDIEQAVRQSLLYTGESLK